MLPKMKKSMIRLLSSEKKKVVRYYYITMDKDTIWVCAKMGYLVTYEEEPHSNKLDAFW